MWTRAELKGKAMTAFRANYWVSVVAALIITVFTAASSSSGQKGVQSATNNSESSGLSGVLVMAVLVAVFAAIIFALVIKIAVGNALIIGSQKIFISNESDPSQAQFSTLGFVFTNGYWKNVAITMFLKDLFVFLWSLLLVIPGIVKGYEYRMIPYLLAENPEMDYKEAFAKSKEMMTGEKWNAFVLDLSFLGWFILSVCTLGILGLFYVNPYFHQTCAELYLTLKESGNSTFSREYE